MISEKLLVIVGETASGKSSLAMRAAQGFGGEIIAADSRTIYKGMDIGTAKPTKADRQLVPHHGLDLVEPDQRYSAVMFKAYAAKTISDISARGHLPIMVGGTGLYVDALVFDYSFNEKQPDYSRSDLDNESINSLLNLARAKGLVGADEVHKNKRHLIRLIERGGSNDDPKVLSPNTVMIGLSPSRARLRSNIESRVEQMFRQGLRKEYNSLSERYGAEHEALTGIGYREFKGWENNEVSMSQVKRNVVKNTLNLAKRQRTWFKRNQNIVWFEDEDSAYEWLTLVYKETAQNV